MNTGQRPEELGDHPDRQQPVTKPLAGSGLPIGVDADLAAFAEGHLHLLLTTDLATTIVAQWPLVGMATNDWRTVEPAVLHSLGECTLCAEQDLRQRAIMVLSLLMANPQNWENHDLILRLTVLLSDWLAQEKEYIPGFEVLSKQLEGLGIWLVAREYWPESWQLFLRLHQISLGLIATNTIIRQSVSRILAGIATPNTLARLLDCYLNGSGTERQSIELLLFLGRNAIVFIMNRLMHSTAKTERLQLVQLIPEIGAEAVPLLLECLQRKPVWYIVRNVIQILARIETVAGYELVEPYLQHPDLRVQLAVVEYIEKKETELSLSRLLAALPQASEELRLILIEKLISYNDQAVGVAFSELLYGRHCFFPHRQTEILPPLVTAMRNFATRDSVDVLKEVIYENRLNPELRKVVLLAEESLRQVEPLVRHLQRTKDCQVDDDRQIDDLDGQQPNWDNLAELNEEIAALLARKDTDAAGEKIYERILIAARQKDFKTAEMLCERLLAVNPNAIAQVVRAGEIIEEEMSASVTRHHLTVWENLYEIMTEEEFNALYFALKRESYDAGEVIVQEGETHAMLYFINSGMVSMSCRTGTGETFLKKIRAGDIQGAEQFFNASIWTTTMRAQSRVDLHVLDRQAMAVINQAHPMVAEKLLGYCRRGNAVYDLLKMSGEDRREYPRYKLSRLIVSTLLNPLGGEKTRRLRVEMLDITRGGLCVALRIANKENAQLLLGRHLEAEIPIVGEKLLTCVGTIVGITFLASFSREFTLHVRFFEELSQSQVMQVVQAEG